MRIRFDILEDVVAELAERIADRILGRHERGQATAIYYFAASGLDIERAARVGVGYCLAQLLDEAAGDDSDTLVYLDRYAGWHRVRR